MAIKKNVQSGKPKCGCSIGDLSKQSPPVKRSKKVTVEKKTISVAENLAQEAAKLTLLKDAAITASSLEPLIEAVLQIGDSAMDNLVEQVAEKIADKVAERVESLLFEIASEG